MIYADFNATTPLLAEVIDAMQDVLRNHWGNASSVHQVGRQARGVVEQARLQVAKALHATPNQVLFTSGGTESNNWVLHAGGCEGHRHVVTTSVEHPAILKPLDRLAQAGSKITIVPVDTSGNLDMDVYAKALENKPTLVSIMAANNESGVIFPIESLAEQAKAVGACFHCDASQAIGKLPFNFGESAVDFATISSHKFYGPKGIGALLVRDRKTLTRFACGGGQEFGLRPGTENVGAIAGMGCALQTLATPEVQDQLRRVGELRDSFETDLAKRVSGIEINGVRSLGRLPNTSNVYFTGIKGDDLLMNLDLEGICCSTASACHSGSVSPSHVLLAMGRSEEQARASIRFSFGLMNTEDEIAKMVQIIGETVDRLRANES